MAKHTVKPSSPSLRAILRDSRSHQPVADRDRNAARARIHHVHGGRRLLCDPDDRRLYDRWARNVAAIYGVVIALTVATLAWGATGPSSGRASPNAAARAAPSPTIASARPTMDR